MARVALVLAAVGLVGGLYFGGAFEFAREPERVRAALEGLGWWSPVIYVLAFALLEPFFVPGVAFMLPGALVYSFPELFLYSWLGAIGAGVVGFGFARTIGRHYVEEHLPERFHRYDRRLAERALRTVIIVRLTLFIMPPAHWLLGLSRVRFGPFLLGTVIGFAPGIAMVTALISFAGQNLGDWLAERPLAFWLSGGLAVLAAAWLRHVVAARRESESATTP